MKKLIENYRKPTPPHARKWGDMALLLIPIIEMQLESMPIAINPMLKWGITTALILFKFYTNTIVDKNIYEGDK